MVLWVIALVLPHLVFANKQEIFEVSGPNVGSHKAVNLVAALKGVSQTLKCFGDITQGSLRLQTRNSDALDSFGDLLKESLAIQKSSMQTLLELEKNAKVVEKQEADCQHNSEENTRNLLKVSDIAGRLTASLHQVEELSANEKRLNNKVQTLERKLKESETQEKVLTAQVENLTNSLATQRSCLEEAVTCVSEHEEIREQVKLYSRTNNWEAFRGVLSLLLDDESLAYLELQDVGNDYISPLNEVARRGYTDLAELLLCHGLAVDFAGRNKLTMLDGAAYTGQLQMAQLLLRHGADIEVRDGYEWTPLISAAAQGHLKMVQWLVQNNAMLTATNNNGQTALDVARGTGHTAVALYLYHLTN